MKEELVGLSYDENMRIRFNKITNNTFWFSKGLYYPELS